jgi:hypothetical protein
MQAMKPYILFVAEDGDQLKQWAIRVDYLLIWLAIGVLCSLFIVARPLLQSTVPQSKRGAAPKSEIKLRWAPHSGIDAGRTVLGDWLGHR